MNSSLNFKNHDIVISVSPKQKKKELKGPHVLSPSIGCTMTSSGIQIMGSEV